MEQYTGAEPLGWRSRGYLPHFEGGEIPQSITFRLFDSFPDDFLERLAWELRLTPPEEIEIERYNRIQDFLDTGHGNAWLSDPAVAEMVQNALLFFDDKRYHLSAWVIMPNHVHALITPLSGWLLSDILHSWKSFTAKEANRLLRRKGHFWYPDYFDRYIRDEKHFAAVVEYFENNPIGARLCEKPEDYLWSSMRRRYEIR